MCDSCANMDTFSRDVCALSSVDGNNQSALMDAARNLAGAFTDLLNIARPGSDEVWPTTTHTHTHTHLTALFPGLPG